MLKKVFSIWLVVAAVGIVPSIAGEKKKKAPDIAVMKEYDKFKDLTTVRVGIGCAPRRDGTIECKGRGDLGDLDGIVGKLRTTGMLSYYQYAEVVYGYTGQAVTQPDNVLFVIVSRMPGWTYAKSLRTLILLVDGERIPLGTMDYDNAADTDGSYNFVALETLSRWIPRETFLRIANAASVEGQVGDEMKFKLDEKQLQAFRILAESWKEAH